MAKDESHGKTGWACRDALHCLLHGWGGGLCPRAITAKAFEEVFSSLFPIVILEVIDDTHEENLFPRDRLSAVILTQRRPALAPHDTR